MKKMMFVLLLIVSIGFLAAVESAPSAVVGYVKYPCVAGLNLVALPMNAGLAMASDLANAYPGTMDVINSWDASIQGWVSAVDLGGFWDGDFAVSPGSVLMVNALSSFNLFSLGSLPTTNATYNLLTGLNSIMVPLNQSALAMASDVGLSVGTLDVINSWDASIQGWVSAVDLGGFWDGDFAVSIGFPLMVNSSAATTWPVRSRAANVLRTSNN